MTSEAATAVVLELQDILREERPCCFTALSLLLLLQAAAVQGAFGEDARQYTRGHDGPDSEDERTDDDGNEYRVGSM